MGCDIHIVCEVRKNGKWQPAPSDSFEADEYEKNRGINFVPAPFKWRSYSMFGFLADVRNYSHSPVIAERKGLPVDLSEENQGIVEDMESYGHSASWLTLKELLDYPYEEKFWDRRVTREESPGFFNGAALANEGEGETVSMRDHLGPHFFQCIEEMKKLGAPEDVRVVFYFDN